MYTNLPVNELSYRVRGAAFKVHSQLGPGLLESVYEAALAYELQKTGLNVRTQVGIPMRYDALQFDVGFRLDLLVEERLVLEIKSVDSLAPVHYKQLLTYLKLAEKPVGFLINFNVISLENKVSLVRLVNNL